MAINRDNNHNKKKQLQETVANIKIQYSGKGNKKMKEWKPKINNNKIFSQNENIEKGN